MYTRFFILVIPVALISGFMAWSEEPRNTPQGVTCTHLLTPLEVKTGPETWSKEKNKFYYQDDLYGFHFMAELKDGVFTLEAHMQDRDQNIRSRLRASDLFQLAFEHFGHFNVKTIEADWIDGVNHSQFHKLKSQRISLEKAAAKTWTGEMAKELGFHKVTEVQLLDNSALGKKARVKVKYERPDTKKFLIMEGIEEFTQSEDIFQYRDSVFEFSFFAIMYGEGTLFISAELINSEKGIRSKYSGVELYRRAIAHFGLENINEIEDFYHGKSIVREQIFTHIANGLTQEQAIKKSVSGVAAGRLGFTEVFDIDFSWKNEVYADDEQPRHMGGRHVIHVKFKRPK